jgi:hypothetical protein
MRQASGRRTSAAVARCRRAAGLFGVAVALLVAVAPPASAHVVQPSDASHYRAQITAVSPSTTLFTAEVAKHGEWVELVAHGSGTLTVLGYFGEPYLRVGPTGIDVNLFAPTEKMNGGLFGTFGPADLDSGHLPPRWHHQQSGQTVRWHDLRATWVAGARPDEVAADPSHSHLIDNWTIHVEAAAHDYTIEGTLRWTPGPGRTSLLLLLFLGVDIVIVAIGAVLLRKRWQGWLPRRHEEQPSASPRMTAPS